MGLTSYTYDNWQGGLNSESAEDMLDTSQLVEAQDVIITEAGRIRRRAGYRKITDVYGQTVIAAGRHQWRTNTQGVIYITTTGSYTRVYFINGDGDTDEICAFPGVATHGSISGAWMKPAKASDSDDYSNSLLNGSIISCDLFTIIFTFNDDGYSSTVKTRDNQLRYKLFGSSDYNAAITYVRGTLNHIGGSGYATCDGSGYTTPATTGPDFPFSQSHYRSGWKYVATGDLFSFGANDGFNPQSVNWSGAQTQAKSKNYHDSQAWDPNDTQHLPSEYNSHITGIKNLNGHIIVFKQDATAIMYPSADGADLSVDSHRTGIGCLDNRSIKPYKDGFVFAAKDGIYLFNGSQSTKISNNIDYLWKDRIRQYVNTNIVSGAIWGDYYMLSNMTANKNLVGGDTLVCHIPSQTWTTFSNLSIYDSCPSPDGTDTWIFIKSGSTTVGVISAASMFDNIGIKDEYGQGPYMVIQLSRLVAGDPELMKRYRQVIVDYVGTSYLGSPRIKVQYTTGLKRSIAGYINWSDEPDLPSIPTLGATYPQQTQQARRYMGFKSTGFGLRLREDTGYGSFAKLEISAIKVKYRAIPDYVEASTIEQPVREPSYPVINVPVLTSSPTTPETGETTTITATVAEPSGNPVTNYQWDLNGDGTYDLDTGLVDNTDTSFATPGNHSVSVKAIFQDGSSSVQYLVIPVTTAPLSVTYTDTPTNPSTSSVHFAWTTTGFPTSVTIKLDGGTAVPVTANTYDYTGLSSTSHTVRVEVADVNGNTAHSDYTWTVS